MYFVERLKFQLNQNIRTTLKLTRNIYIYIYFPTFYLYNVNSTCIFGGIALMHFEELIAVHTESKRKKINEKNKNKNKNEKQCKIIIEQKNKRTSNRGACETSNVYPILIETILIR